MPNQGLQILYEILNDRDDAVAERAYAPWTDLADQMRAAGVPLFSVDSHRPARDFDILAFNLSSELVYTNLLEMIDLAGLAVRSADRTENDPLVLVGGHAAFNPEPIADFVDAAVLGEGEEVVSEITEVVARWQAKGGRDRLVLLRQLARIPGVYVPSLYEVTYDGDLIAAVTPIYSDAAEVVGKRLVADLGDWPYPTTPLVPLTEVVHDRLSVEVFRGCTRSCRFCQAGMVSRPVRERPPDQIRDMVAKGIEHTGYDEVSLTSLSTADYSDVGDLIHTILDDQSAAGCSSLTVSLPSLRVDAFTVGLAGEVSNGRRSGLTFAPEAGSWRLRQVINKMVSEEDLFEAVEAAFSEGWTRMKLYFLTGLPTETDEDTLAIVDLARRCVEIGKRHTNRASVTVSLGGFVPKPQRVWRQGGIFQEWGEYFDLDLWTEALTAEGLSLDHYVFRHRRADEILPWSHLSVGVDPDYLWEDWEHALAGSGVDDCRWTPCYDCGVCTGYDLDHVISSSVAPGSSSDTESEVPVAVGSPEPVVR